MSDLQDHISNMSNLQDPDINMSNLQDPDIDMSDLQDSEIDMSDLQDSDIDMSDVEDLDDDISDTEDFDDDISDAEDSDFDTSDTDDPEVDTPSVQSLDQSSIQRLEKTDFKEVDTSRLQHLRRAEGKDLNLSHLRNLVDEYAWCLITSDTPDWFAAAIFKATLGDRKKFDKAAKPLNFAPGVHDVLLSGAPPTIDFFRSLPTPDPQVRVWAIYVLVLEKPGCPAKLYVGSGTKDKYGVMSRMQQYDKGQMLPRLVRAALKNGYTVEHRGLLCWGPIPSELEVTVSRIRFVAIEAVFTAIFHTCVGIRVDVLWSAILPWARSEVTWLPLATHTPLWECPRVISGMTEEQLETYYAERKERRRKAECLQSRRKRAKAQAQDPVTYRTKHRNQGRSWERRNQKKRAAKRAESHAKAIASKKFFCTLCTRPYASAVRYRRHLTSKMHIENERLASGGRPKETPLPENERKLELRIERRANKTFYCEDCDYSAGTQQALNKHLQTPKHQNQVAGIEPEDPSPGAQRQRKLVAENLASKTFYCGVCDYNAGTQTALNTHLQTSKHKDKVASIDLEHSLSESQDQASKRYHCGACNLNFGSQTGLSRHFQSIKHQNKVAGTEHEKPIPKLKQAKEFRAENIANKRFYCGLCNFNGGAKWDLNMHYKTKKHLENAGRVNGEV